MKKYTLFVMLLLLTASHALADGRKIAVINDNRRIEFELNDTPAATSLWDQLPMSADVENYSNNEKIFYPPEKVDTADSLMEDCPVGTLAYFAPWGDVVMYYGSASRYNGLYVLGHATSGVEEIRNLSGRIQVEKITSGGENEDDNVLPTPENPSSNEPSNTGGGGGGGGCSLLSWNSPNILLSILFLVLLACKKS